jgi:hypothetical protein
MAFAQHTQGGGPGIARLARWGATRVHLLPTGTGRPCSDPLVLFSFTRTVPSPPRALYAEPCVCPAHIVCHRDGQEIGGCVMAKQHGLPAGQPLTRPAFYIFSSICGAAPSWQAAAPVWPMSTIPSPRDAPSPHQQRAKLSWKGRPLIDL